MSTSCVIGYLTTESTVRFVRCLSDGMPEGVGSMLREHYDNYESAVKLVEEGDISSFDLISGMSFPIYKYPSEVSEETMKDFLASKKDDWQYVYRPVKGWCVVDARYVVPFIPVHIIIELRGLEREGTE